MFKDSFSNIPFPIQKSSATLKPPLPSRPRSNNQSDNSDNEKSKQTQAIIVPNSSDANRSFPKSSYSTQDINAKASLRDISIQKCLIACVSNISIRVFNNEAQVVSSKSDSKIISCCFFPSLLYILQYVILFS